MSKIFQTKRSVGGSGHQTDGTEGKGKGEKESIKKLRRKMFNQSIAGRHSILVFVGKYVESQPTETPKPNRRLRCSQKGNSGDDMLRCSRNPQ